MPFFVSNRNKFNKYLKFALLSILMLSIERERDRWREERKRESESETEGAGGVHMSIQVAVKDLLTNMCVRSLNAVSGLSAK
jgi:hypothetical protein